MLAENISDVDLVGLNRGFRLNYISRRSSPLLGYDPRMAHPRGFTGIVCRDEYHQFHGAGAQYLARW